MTAETQADNNSRGMAENPVFSVSRLCFGYSGSNALLNNVDFALFPGQSIGLAGKNGCGKTTFFRCIAGLEKIWSGEIFLNGSPIKNEMDFIRMRRSVAFSVQNASDQLFFATALEDVMFGPLNLGLPQEMAEARGLEWLAKVGLQGFEKRQTAHLSGGQQKLLALAGIFAMEPTALLLDEPFNGLDATTTDRICAIINETRAARIMVCHNETLLRQLCPEIMRLQDGRLEKNPASSAVPEANAACGAQDVPEHHSYSPAHEDDHSNCA